MSGEAEWDVSKENFVPVRQGRPTSALVATPLSVRKVDRELEEAKSAFLAEIEASEDPLTAWLKYIKWTQDQYSTQASRKELTQVLEAATKALSSMTCYQQDVRLLRLWVQYADCLPDPNSVFLFLEDHSIGRDHALFYEAYAAYLELKGNFSQAELVYQEGINRLAKPLERLKQKHAGFNQRMAKRRERQESEAALGMGAAAADATAARSSLAPLVPMHAAPQLDENGLPIQQQRMQGRTAMGLPQQQQQPASVALGVRPAPLAAPSSSRGSSSRLAAGSGAASLWAPTRSGTGSQQRSNALLLSSLGVPGAPSSSSSNAAPRQLDIHVDDEFGPKGQGPTPTAFPPSQQLHAQLPGLAAATKENSSQPAAWAGTKLKQQGVFAAPVSTKLEVFEDDDEDSDDAGGSVPEHASQQQQQQQQQPQQHPVINPLLAPLAPAPAKTAHGSAAGGNQHRHPLQVATTAGGSGKPEGPLQAPAAPKQHHGSSTSSSKAPAFGAAAAPLQGYSEALLVGADGQEQSFEEVRAAVWRQANTVKQQQQPSQQPQQKQQQPAAGDKAASGKARVADAQCDQALAAADVSQGSSKAASSRARQPLGARPASPDLAAGDAVALPDQRSAAHTAAAAAPTKETISSKAERTSGSSGSSRRPFGAPLAPAPLPAADAGCSSAVVASAHSPSAAPGDDSGVTISTQAAFDAMNGMFGGGDDTTTVQGFGRAAAGAAAGHRSAAAAAAAAADAGGVTINTRAALDAMNGMFGGGDDTTIVHGFGRAAAGAAAGHTAAAAADAGGVTINTHAAMDAVNGMFGGSDDTTTMHGFGRAAARSRRSMAAADVGGVTINTRAAFDAMNGMFGGDDTTTMHGFGRAAGAGDHSSIGADAGVTVNTRAAFDYMNGVFGGAGDVTLGQTAALAGRKGARKTSRLSVAPAAAAAASAGSGQGAALGVYEDTEMIGGPGMGPVDMGQGGMFGVYEDTEFVGAKMAAAAAGSSGRRSGAAMPGSGGLGLYEDTDFITHHVGGAAAGSSDGHSMEGPGPGQGGAGLGLYEDTDFITRPMGGAGGGSNSRQGGGPSMAGMGSSGGGMGLYEDTEFITRTVGSSGQSVAAAAGPALGEAGAGLGVYEDTEFVMRPVPPAAANSGSSSSSMLRSKLNRLSLANEALYRGQGIQQQQQGSFSSRDGEHTGPHAGRGSSFGVYEDTEFMLDTVRRDSSSTYGALEVCADTEFLTKPVSAAAAGHIGAGQQLSGRVVGSSSSWDAENVPAAADSRQQQQQGRSSSCGPQVPLGPHPMAPAGPCSSGSGSILQQHQHGYGGAGPSRFGPSSVPGSPLGAHSRPGSAATTPSRPPRTPGTPGAALGPLARHMDAFEVMESPAVREALAGRPLHPGTAGNSPAGSLASSPGCGASENLPGPGFEGKLQPRSLADRSARAAALQPISAVRAEQLGVQVGPNAVLDEEDGECDQQQQKGMARQSPGRALRSLQFGREPGPSAR